MIQPIFHDVNKHFTLLPPAKKFLTSGQVKIFFKKIKCNELMKYHNSIPIKNEIKTSIVDKE